MLYDRSLTADMELSSGFSVTDGLGIAGRGGLEYSGFEDAVVVAQYCDAGVLGEIEEVCWDGGWGWDCGCDTVGVAIKRSWVVMFERWEWREGVASTASVARRGGRSGREC